MIPSMVDIKKTKVICLCAVCHQDILDGQPLADHIKIDFDGEVDYIELAHHVCAELDNQSHPGYWNFD